MNDNKTMLIGVDLGGTNMRVGMVSPAGQISHCLKLPTRVDLGMQEVVRRIIKTIREVINQTEVPEDSLKGIGIGSPGIIDIKSGIIINSPNFPKWEQVPLKQMIEEEISIPTFVDNDANAFAFGEKWVGVGKEVQSLVCLTLGTGVGGGIILDDRLWHGADGMAAEIGHMTVVPNGLKCNCGNYGCLESYASASSVVRRTRDAIQSGKSTSILEHVNGDPEKITSYSVYQAALKKDDLALQIMRETAIFLGIGITNLINILNPEMIVVGGGLSNAWDLIYPITVQEIQKRIVSLPIKRTHIVRASLGDDAGIIGSAGIAYFNLT